MSTPRDINKPDTGKDALPETSNTLVTSNAPLPDDALEAVSGAAAKPQLPTQGTSTPNVADNEFAINVRKW